jgi:type I restriction enzyme, S subunit
MDADLFLQQFGHLVQVEGGIKKLRDVILQLAVRGKLVEQNPYDEPAEVLLKEIEAERNKLAKAGRIKTPKLTPILSSKEVMFDLPNNWAWTRLGNIGSIFNGDSISISEKEREYTKRIQGYNYIATKDVDFVSRKINYDNGIKIPFDNKGFKVAHKDAVLICAEGGSAGKKIAITEEDICFGNKLYAIETFSGLFPRYLFYVYQSPYFYKEFSLTTTGIIGGTSINKFNQIPVPIPPLAEQKRIVAKVDELMALCDKLEAEQETQRTLKTQAVQSTLHYLTSAESPASFGSSLNILERTFGNWFDDLATVKHLRATILQLAVRGNISVDSEVARTTNLPRNWRQCKLGELLSFGPKNGYSPKPVDYETQTKSLTLSATTSGSFDASKTKFIDESIPADSQLWLDKGDILIQRGNSSEYVGVSAIYNGKRGVFIYPDLMMKIRVTEESIPEYIHIALLAPTTRAYFLQNATGTSGSMPKINQAVVKNTPIPLPSLAEQKRIVAKVDELMTLCDQLESNITTTNSKNTQLMDALVYTLLQNTEQSLQRSDQEKRQCA